MFRINKKLSQKGFSLMEVMVAVGLMGLTAVATMQMNSNMTKSSSALKVKMDASQLQSEMINTFMSEDNCSKALKGNDFDLTQASTNEGQDVSLLMPNDTRYLSLIHI